MTMTIRPLSTIEFIGLSETNTIGYISPQTQVILEESQAMPGQGTRSMCTIGPGMGVWLGMLATLGLAHTRVRLGVWKKALGLGKDKEAARLRGCPETNV